jgi:TorA maturation chaperone TorD
VAARLAREYADAGLDVSPSLNEPSDHAAVELEFMAFLCDTEARAWEEQAVEEGIQSLARQRLFLTEHLDQWFPAFARRILRVDRGRFYTVVAEAAQAFTHHDGDLLDLLLHQGRVAGAAAASEWRAGVTA